MEESPGAITAHLREHEAGSPLSLNALFELVYPELRRMARVTMRGERSAHTLQPTALVHEAFIRLFDGEPIQWANSRHFFARAALAMRSALVDYARRTLSDKRHLPDSGWPPAFTAATGLSPERVIHIGLAIERLSGVNPRAATIVELRFFGGFEMEEIASALGIHPRTVFREWSWAKAALRLELGGLCDPPSNGSGSFSPQDALTSLSDEPRPAGEDEADL